MAAVFELPPFRGEGVGGPVEDAPEEDVGVTDTSELLKGQVQSRD